MFYSEFQKGIQRRLESQKEKKRNEKNLNPPEVFCITFRIPEENSKLAQAEKRIKLMKIGFYSSSQKEEKKRQKPKKVGFYRINLYFRGIVSLRKRINDFSQLQQLHKFQTPLLALSREKTTDKEREKEKTLLESLSRRIKKDRE